VTPTIILLSVVTWIPRGNKDDDSEKNGFIFPDFVNNNKDIVVVDMTSDDTGRVMVVGWEGGLRWTYTGHSKINVTTQFNPVDVVTTTAGHILENKNVSCLN
jgi:hypothetical protein